MSTYLREPQYDTLSTQVPDTSLEVESLRAEI